MYRWWETGTAAELQKWEFSGWASSGFWMPTEIDNLMAPGQEEISLLPLVEFRATGLLPVNGSAGSNLDRRSFRDCRQILRRNEQQIFGNSQTPGLDPFGGSHPMLYPVVDEEHPGVFVLADQFRSLDQFSFPGICRRNHSSRGAHQTRRWLFVAQYQPL